MLGSPWTRETSQPHHDGSFSDAIHLSNSVAVLIVLLACITFAGCKRQVAKLPPAPTNTTTSVTEETNKSAVESTETPVVEGSEQTDSADEPVNTAANDSDDPQPIDSQEGVSAESSIETLVDEVAELEPTPSERFLLLTRDGPLVIDVILKIDNEPHTRALDHLLKRVMSELTDDGDASIEWTEAVDHPAFAYGQFGNLAAEDDEQKTQLIEMYDTNRNSLVDRDELPRFLTRNVGGSRSFSLRSSNEFRGDNRTRSPVRRILDADHDGAITVDEMVAAPNRLFDRDADDDEILVLEDCKDTVEQMQPQMSNQRRVNAPDTAILFSERTRWGYVSYALQETYAYGDRVGIDDIPLTPELVGLLDKNGNSLIDNNEVAELANVPAHLVLQVDFFDDAAAGDSTAPKITIVSASESLRSVLNTNRQDTNRLSFELPGADVDFFVNEDPSFANTAQVLQNQFTAFDSDNNGYLNSDEYSGQILGFDLPFEGLDTDDNGMVYLDEVTALVKRRQSVIRAQIRARAADREDALFTALDTNGDGRLAAREIYGSTQLLKELDRNGDDQVQSHEIPGTMAVGFVRGNSQQDNTLLVMPAVARQNRSEDLPPWFNGMDSNGDGDISPREFLGSREKFEQLDKDSDGFVSADEAKQFGV